MNGREVHQLDDIELGQRLRDSYQELFNLRFQKANREITNHMRIGMVRRDIARFKTVLRERELETAPMGDGIAPEGE